MVRPARRGPPAGWEGRPEGGPLLHPCCGSGTLVIEAPEIACGIGLAERFPPEFLAWYRGGMGRAG